MKGITLDTRPQKTPRYSCKQTAHHPTTTVPDFEVSTFAGFADKRRIHNSLCLLFVVLHGRNGQNFQQQKNSDQSSRIANHAWSWLWKRFYHWLRWHIKLTPNADNNSCPIPGQHSFEQTFITICIIISQFHAFLFKIFPLLVTHISPV